MKVVYNSSVPLETLPDGHCNRCPRLFAESVRKFNIPAENFTLGVELNSRELVFAKLTASLGVMSDEIVLVTDAWDVFFCCGVEEIEQKFLEFNSTIVFQMEQYLFPGELAQFGEWPPAPTRYRGICGGGMVGRADAIIELYHKLWLEGYPHNQYAFNRGLIEHPEEFAGKLDHHCRIMQTLNSPLKPLPIETLSIRNGRVYNAETNQFPCLVHGNGGSIMSAISLWDRMK